MGQGTEDLRIENCTFERNDGNDLLPRREAARHVAAHLGLRVGAGRLPLPAAPAGGRGSARPASGG